eukprot:TRINITY_DN48994_c0_g1_i1.p1 TRINITY_DN48994_c0_g1~~TRINITY_DN48994_c0_g1_i1.p1  ORF type:complete len:817 (-),score=184.81 TRINITY_DN48994_c0_g1_i1:32-2482(-)
MEDQIRLAEQAKLELSALAGGGPNISRNRMLKLFKVFQRLSGRSTPCFKLSEEETDSIITASGNSGQEVDFTRFIDFIFSSPQKTPSREELLKGVKLLEGLSNKDISDLAAKLEICHFKTGDKIISQGEEGFECFVIEAGEAFAQIKIGDEFKEVKRYEEGGFFGERALLRSEPRAADVLARTEVRAFRLQRKDFVDVINYRDMKENLVKATKLFENMSDQNVHRLAAAFQRQVFRAGEKIITQGEEGRHFYLLEEGECQASIETSGQSQVVKEYVRGELFGEKALLEKAPRLATVTATSDVVALVLSREDFERALGPLSQLMADEYLADPRKLIADFYMPGDQRGPAGTLAANGFQPATKDLSKWFAVYRPCSRDAIAKMLGRNGVGKGLNVKGKSSKKNRLSGFVPFIQISNNSHKDDIEASPRDARTCIYYRNAASREAARAALQKALQEVDFRMDEPELRLLDEYPSTPGLDIPEPLMREVYIMRADVSPILGWETGRASEPAFMDMNLGSVRGKSAPKVVLYQFDITDPMNPLGLLVAYAEKAVHPVVSDFDTFTVGSKGISYESLPDNQRELVNWELEHAHDIIGSPGSQNWTQRWLEVLKHEAAKGFHPEIPKYGFGDPTSVRIISDVVNVTSPCGAVRHGAECFNFYFPQELDDEFLVVWDGYSNPPWRQLDEDELRSFLLERADEGFVFPINPVWPMRDIGWYDVLQALRNTEEGKQALECWLTEDNLSKIDEVHEDCPDGFQVVNLGSDRRVSVMTSFQDLTGEEMADFVRNEVRKVERARWAKIRAALLFSARTEALRQKENARS